MGSWKTGNDTPRSKKWGGISCLVEEQLAYQEGVCSTELVKSNPITGLDGPWGFQEVEAPRFQDNRHINVVRLSALRTGHLYPQETFLVLISVRGWVDPRVIVRPEELCQWRNPIIILGIEPSTFRLGAQCFHQLRHCVPPTELVGWSNCLCLCLLN